MNRALPFILKHFPPGPYPLCLCVSVRRQVRVRALFLLFILLLLNTAVPARGETQLTLLKGEAVNEKEARLFFMVFDETGKPVAHPQVDELFSGLQDGSYVVREDQAN